MFLVTTADQRYWKTDEKILFLGEWCRTYDQSDVWSKLDYEVLPYHWDDRRKLQQDYLHLQGTYERYLSSLACRLNEVHKIDRSLRYWRILIGPWLLHFVQILYDRYFCLTEAAKRPVTLTRIVRPDSDPWIPNDLQEFIEGSQDDQHNHYLYSYLISKLNIPFEISEQIPLATKEAQITANGLSLRLIVRELLRLSSRLVPDNLNKLVIVDSYLDPANLLKLQCSLGQLPYLFAPTVVAPESPVDATLRQKLNLQIGSTRFESILDSLIPIQIPRIYLEGYVEMDQRSIACFPKRPRQIFTANVIADEGLKFWAARKIESGASLIVAQHGGHYGSCAYSSFEEHEICISDRFFTWGWQTEGEPNTIPMPAGKVLKGFQTLKANPKGTILWVDLSISRYSIWLSAGPSGPQMLAYLDDQLQFARNVSPAVHELLLLRLYARDHGWNLTSRWKDSDPTLKLYRGPISMVEQLRESRLMIATCNSTTVLETLGANFPTLAFWNPDHWELRSEAQPYFDELREIGILFDTPEAAAEKVNEIYQDIESWWRDPKLQKVRERFCRRFARTDPDWLRIWRAELLREANCEK